MLNFEIKPGVLTPFVPDGTEIDFWNGKTFVSIVGFRFLRTKVLGVPIPFHRDFDEINLRFYVRRQAADGWRRGVVFIKEIVPRWMVACVARTVYGENYVTRRMRSDIQLPVFATSGQVRYEWKHQGRWNRLAAMILDEPRQAGPEDEATFITEHYWGYARQRDGGTMEYQVEHPPWRVWRADSIDVDADWRAEYGDAFALFLNRPPTSVFVAEGSAIVVRRGSRLI